jgi:hypothetical protein
MTEHVKPGSKEWAAVWVAQYGWQSLDEITQRNLMAMGYEPPTLREATR